MNFYHLTYWSWLRGPWRVLGPYPKNIINVFLWHFLGQQEMKLFLEEAYFASSSLAGKTKQTVSKGGTVAPKQQESHKKHSRWLFSRGKVLSFQDEGNVGNNWKIQLRCYKRALDTNGLCLVRTAKAIHDWIFLRLFLSLFFYFWFLLAFFRKPDAKVLTWN